MPCRQHPPARRRTRLLAAAVASCFAASAQALPTAPQVANGTATFSQNGNTLTVTNSNGAIINWNTFSIGANETTRFLQPSASSSVLNRVLSADPSRIYGNLSSNGHVWLVNPAGIFVGPGARIDAAGFVGSTLNVSDADFLAGRLNFLATPGAGAIVNQGTIATPSGGSVYLVAPNVTNEGSITTPGGETLLAAGQTVQLIDTATPGVKVEIAGAEGTATNLGQIVAAAGQIGMAGVLVKNSGTLDASSVVSEGGRIFLRATGDAYVDGNARVNATGTTGGRVEVLGNRVAVTDNASIDASGANGGGTVLVGGDYQGSNPAIQNAAITYFGPDTSIRADATDAGNGGKVIVWADDATRAYGSISARGGDKGGDGGFVETSGHRYLDFQGHADMRAPGGRAGLLLLDPSDITIDNSTDNLAGGSFSPGVFSGATTNATLSWNTINTQLGFGGLEIRTNSGGNGGNGDILINASGTLTNSNYLTLLANRNISFAANAVLSGAGDINLISGWNNSGWVVTSGTGTISFANGSGLSTPGNVYVNVGGALNVQAGANINVGGKLEVGTTSTATYGNVTINGNVQSAGALQTINTSGSLAVTGTTASAASLWYSGTGTQTIAASSVTVQGDPSGGNGHSATIMSSGTQDFTTGDLSLTGGGYGAGPIGYDNWAEIAAGGSQTFSLSGNLTLQGGAGGTAGHNNRAGIEAGRTVAAATQTFYFTKAGGTTVQLTGGSSSGTGGYADSACGAPCQAYSANSGAEIHNQGSGLQKLDFQVGAANQLTLQGGSGGGGNDAGINAESGPQWIGSTVAATSYPTIQLTGGTGGTAISHGGVDYYMDNSANIGSKSSQVIQATGITMAGGGGGTSFAGAFMGSPHADITVTGALTMNATGSAPADHKGSDGSPLVESFVHLAPVAIGDQSSNWLHINAGSVSLGATTPNSADGGSPAMLGSLYGTTDLSIVTTGNLNVGSATANAYGSNVMIGSRTLAGGTVVLNSGAGNLSLGQAFVGSGYGASDSVSLTSNGGGLGQAVGGVIRTHTLSATYGGAGTLSLPGANEVDFVTLTAPNGDVNYTSNRDFHLISATAGASPGVAITTQAGAKAFIGTITTGNQNVTISADGGIYDDNGAGVANIDAGTGAINLTSNGGIPGNLAISLDTVTTGSLSATVNAVAGNSGGVSIRNASASTPGTITIADHGANNASVAFSQTGNLVLNSANQSFRADNNGDISVASPGGNLTYGGGATFTITTGGSVLLGAAAGNLTVSGPLSVTGSLGLAAGGTLQVNGAVTSSAGSVLAVAPILNLTQLITATSGDVALLGGTVDLSSAGSVNAGTISLLADNFTATGSGTYLNASTGPLVGIIANDMRLNNGVHINGASGIDLSFLSPASTLYLNDTAGLAASSLNAPVGNTINLVFSGRYAGGVVLDGVESVISPGASGSSFIVGGAPALLGSGLSITYGGINPVAGQIVDAINGSTSGASATDTTTGVPATVTDPTLAPTTAAGGTVGGGEDEFGQENGTSKDKKDSQDTSNGKKPDDKPSGKKPGQCAV